MGEVYKQKITLKIIIYAFILSCMLMIITTPLHESAHWVMSDIDPYIEPVEIHLFDFESNYNSGNVMSSALGYVVVKEIYPGAFTDRPYWMDLLQEIICIFIQILLTIIVVSKILKLLIQRDLKPVKISI